MRVLYEKLSNMKKLFTIIEVLISMIIIWIIIVIVFKVYLSIFSLSIRVENEKIMNNELLYVSQVIQHLSDNNSIDYSKYSVLLSGWYGFTWTLHLIWSDGQISIYTTWDCNNSLVSIAWTWCWIQMNKDGYLSDLTNKDNIFIKNMYFKIIAYEDAKTLHLDFERIYQEGFWLFAEIYIKRYQQDKREFNIKQEYQNFFNIRVY